MSKILSKKKLKKVRQQLELGSMKTTMNMPKHLLLEVDKECKKMKISRTELVTALLKEFVA